MEPTTTKVPTYDPEDDETFDFEDTELTKEEDLMDLDELNDVKLDIEWSVCLNGSWVGYYFGVKEMIDATHRKDS